MCSFFAAKCLIMKLEGNHAWSLTYFHAYDILFAFSRMSIRPELIIKAKKSRIIPRAKAIDKFPLEVSKAIEVVSILVRWSIFPPTIITAPISTNLILSYIGEHVLKMPRSY